MIWLAWRELNQRPIRFMASVATVAMVVGLFVAIELLAVSREMAISLKMDSIGPSLRLVPKGISAGNLARFEIGDTTFPESILLRKGLNARDGIRAVEVRLVRMEILNEAKVPVMGIMPGNGIPITPGLDRIDAGEIILGSDLATRLQKRAGDLIIYRGKLFKISHCMSESGGPEDLALFLSLSEMQQLFHVPQQINELRLFLTPDVNAEALAHSLEKALPEISVIRNDRGEVADEHATSSLRRYSRILFFVLLLTGGIFLSLAAILNIQERRLELATLCVLGTTRNTLFLLLVARSMLIGALGGLAGYLLGVLSTLFIGLPANPETILSPELLLTSVGGTILVSILASLLPAWSAAGREDCVTALQE